MNTNQIKGLKKVLGKMTFGVFFGNINFFEMIFFEIIVHFIL